MHPLPRRLLAPAVRAFTLVELLVVIGIIALLISILLPSLNSARQAAANVKDLSNLRSIGQGIAIYAGTNKGSLPFGYWSGSADLSRAPTAAETDRQADWATLVMGALGKGYGDYNHQNGAENSKLQQLFMCPVAKFDDLAKDTTKRKLHYSAHPRLMPDLSDVDKLRDPSGTAGVRLKPYKLNNIKRSSDIILVFDGSQCNIIGYPPGELDWNANAVAKNLDAGGLYTNMTQNGRKWNYLVMGPGVDGNAAVYASNGDAPPNTANAFDIRWRHNRNDTANFLFVDGHCGSFRLRLGQNADLKTSNVYLDNP